MKTNRLPDLKTNQSNSIPTVAEWLWLGPKEQLALLG
jgi:hypothetical protein